MLQFDDSLTFFMSENGWENYFKDFLKRGNLAFDDSGEGGKSGETALILAALFDQSPIGYVVVRPDDSILLINKAAEQLMDFNRSTYPELLWSDIKGRKQLFLGEDIPLPDDSDPVYIAMRERRRNSVSILARNADSMYDSCLSVTAYPIQNAEGELLAVCVVMLDVTEFKDMQDVLYFHATHDPLTGLSNRALLYSNLSKAFARSKRNMTGIAVLLIDIDNFKAVNDTYGHAAGDELLVKIAKRIASEVRETDIVARIGGDEFAILLTDISDIENTAMVAQITDRICGSFARPFVIRGQAVEATASVGVSLYPRDGEDEKTLMFKADAAMYQIKASGRNGWKFWEGEELEPKEAAHGEQK